MSKNVERRYKSIENDKKVDLTNFDFSTAPLYQTKDDGPFLAVEELTENETIVRSWGIQEMKAGDFVVLKPSSKGGFKRSGVRKDAFFATYVEDSTNPGFYKKMSFIRAVKIDHDFTFVGVDSDRPEQAPAGSFLVLNLDKNKNPIIINGKRDIFFYSPEDLSRGYDQVNS